VPKKVFQYREWLNNIQSFMDKLLQQTIDLAKQAGEEVMKIYNRGFTQKEKQDKSPVTEADLASEKIILQGLKKTGITVLSEETEPDSKWFEKDKIWMVDPLDGTKDFIQKTGEFSVMIALVENKEPILGVIYQPTTNTLYFAEKDKGAFIQEGAGEPEKIKVSDVSELSDARIILSRNHTSQAQKDFVKKHHFANAKHIGSAGLKIVAVSSQKAEAYFTESDKAHQWDTAAGECILKEAGGIITDIKGNPLIYCKPQTNHQNGILVCNSSLHPKILQALKETF